MKIIFENAFKSKVFLNEIKFRRTFIYLFTNFSILMMKKATINFSSMVPTIIFEENLISELLLISRQRKSAQLVLIAQVQVKNSKVEFRCSTLISDPESEISVREDEVPIYVDILPESQYQQPDSIEIEEFRNTFYKMMEETSNQYNANNIYSLISDVAFINNQLNVRLSLFCPKSSIEIEEIDSSDAPSVCSIPGATYRFPKDKKFKDPNSIYAIYYGINGIKDPRIYSLSYSIYLQKHKKISAAFNKKLYRITFHENEEFELLTTTFTVSKPTTITTRFNNLDQTNNDLGTYMPKQVQGTPSEIYESINSMKKEISDLREIISEQGRQLESKIEEHNEEIKAMLQSILSEVQKPRSIERSNSKTFLNRQISRKPVVLLEISLSSIFENHQSSANNSYQQQIPPTQQVYQQPQEIKKQIQSKQQSRFPTENPNLQVPQQANFIQSQNTVPATIITDTITSSEQTQQTEHQHTKYSADMKASFEKRRSTSRDNLNTSAPTVSTQKTSQFPIAQSPVTNHLLSPSAINDNNNNNITNIKQNNNNTPKVNLSILKNGVRNNSRTNKLSSINAENRSDNSEFTSKFLDSRQSNKFSNQFNEPSFDLSSHIPDSLNESPNRKDNINPLSEFSFLTNESMDTNRFFEAIGYSNKPNS